MDSKLNDQEMQLSEEQKRTRRAMSGAFSLVAVHRKRIRANRKEIEKETVEILKRKGKD